MAGMGGKAKHLSAGLGGSWLFFFTAGHCQMKDTA